VVRLSGIVTESLVDGPGVRYVIFTQGCPHECPHCHNPETWDKNGGEEFSLLKIERQIKMTRKKYKGITFSGGEPFLQPAELAHLAKVAKKRGWDVVTFTGYLYEELEQCADSGVQALLEVTDILIDGRFEHALLDTTLPFRGSLNQRMIDLNATRECGEVILFTEEKA